MSLITELVNTIGELLAAFSAVISDGKLRAYYLAPFFIGVGVFLLCLAVSVAYLNEFSVMLFGPSEYDVIAGSAALLIALFFSLIIAFIAATVLGAYYVEKMLERRRAPDAKVAPVSMFTGIFSQLVYSLVLGGIALGVFCLSFIPVLLAPIFLINALIVGSTFFDLALFAELPKLRDRLSFQIANLSAVLALGLIYSVTYIVPLLPIILMPLFYLAAGAKYARLKKLNV